MGIHWRRLRVWAVLGMFEEGEMIDDERIRVNGVEYVRGDLLERAFSLLRESSQLTENLSRVLVEQEKRIQRLEALAAKEGA